ncbi:5'-3' exonuclease [Actinopolyspora halophila]|uniref:5'-3' exonuclease n=1 Tax=Actinopolyspora halophila TaxID=1850 RepID=UPI00036E0D64|nr:5'-3' exonuclease [Actinopolyspora halophila]
MRSPVMLVDAAGLWFRSYYALPESLTAPDGSPVNAVRGFCDTLARLLTERSPGRLVVCLDNDWRPEFRVRALPSYKSHRVAEETPEAEAVPDTLTPQIPVILDLLAALGVDTAEAEGYEADDVIATLAEVERDDPVEVITGDRDLFQLVRNEPTPTRVIYMGGGLNKLQDYGPAELAERYGLPHEETGRAYADMAVLRGDPSDGLAGVAGIGEKTAAKLVSRFGSLENLLEAAANGDTELTPRNRAKLVEANEYLAAAPSVVRAVTDAPVEHTLSTDVRRTEPVDTARVSELQRERGLGSPVDRLVAALG